MTRGEILRELFEKYNLIYDRDNPDSKDNDVYVHKHYTIITRGGIQKIEQAGGWKCTYQIHDSGADFCNISGEIFKRRTDEEFAGYPIYMTLASANKETCKNGYYTEMAEKRCRSRLILTVAGLYELGGIYGEDESDDFKKETPKTLYKGQ